MEANETVRASHRTDWLSVFLGTTATFALLGVTSMILVPMGLLAIQVSDSIPWIVTKLFLNITSLIGVLYVGGYLAGLTLSYHSRPASAVTGLLVWQMTALLFGLTGWLGYAPLPGIYFEHGNAAEAGPGLLWLALIFLMPLAIPTAYGAMAGNDHVAEPELDQADIERRFKDQAHGDRTRAA